MNFMLKHVHIASFTIHLLFCTVFRPDFDAIVLISQIARCIFYTLVSTI